MVDYVDGNGFSFPPEAQARHLEYILRALQTPPDPPKQYPQVEWKDKPAGHYNKGIGV